jgi:2OG-Fe(II) oxygenase superfamily
VNKIYLDEQIFYVDNFLDKEFHEYINKIALDNSNWEQDEPKVLPQRRVKDLTFSQYDVFWDHFLNKLNQIFDLSIYDKSINRHITSFLPFDQYSNAEYAFGLHQDDSGYKKAWGIKNTDPILLFGCVYYLNDNYEGGELVYGSKGISIKPNANSLVVHSAGDDYDHGVKQVFGSTRYSMPFFIKTKQN